MAEEKNMDAGFMMERERYINPYTDFGFDRLFEQAEIAKYTPEERREYEVSIKNYWDYYSTMKTSHDKGVDEGKKIGRNEANLENGRKMKELGVATDVISQVTGLTTEEIAAL